MKQAKTEVHNRVVSYLKEHLGGRCDLNNVEVYVGGDPSVGEGHLYLVMAKDRQRKYGKDDTYSCWTCWNDKVGSLNFGHYDLGKDGAMNVLMEHEPILDREEVFIVEDCNEEEEPRIFANEVQMHRFATSMLRGYFEAASDYGDPVGELMKYVPPSKAGELLSDYSYEVSKGTRERYREVLRDFESNQLDSQEL